LQFICKLIGTDGLALEQQIAVDATGGTRQSPSGHLLAHILYELALTLVHH
jgi:hypothetical protein